MSDRPTTTGRRKLLVAAIGVGALNLVGCGKIVSGNLMAPPPCEVEFTPGYCPQLDGGADGGTDGGSGDMK
jgi:hypothetical protein